MTSPESEDIDWTSLLMDASAMTIISRCDCVLLNVLTVSVSTLCTMPVAASPATTVGKPHSPQVSAAEIDLLIFLPNR